MIYQTEPIQFYELIGTYCTEKKKLKFAVAFKQFFAIIYCFSSSKTLCKH